MTNLSAYLTSNKMTHYKVTIHKKARINPFLKEEINPHKDTMMKSRIIVLLV